MLTVLAGDNDFALSQALSGLTEGFLAEYGPLALEQLDGEESSVEKMEEALNGLPFLTARKMVVLRSAGKNKQFMEKYEQILGGLPDSTEAVLVEAHPDKRTSYFKFLKKQPGFKEFGALDQNGLAHWLTDTAKQKGGSLAPSDARYLVERVGTDQQRLSSELEKLLIYDSKISRESINLLTEAAPQSTIFQLMETAFAGNSRRTFELYAEQRAQKVEPPQIIAMLAWQLHILAVIKTAGDRTPDQIAKEAKLSPFVVRKSAAVARRLSLGQLKNMIKDLMEIDEAIKRTSIDADEALQNYLLKFGAGQAISS
jgi:DNA polymerase-3 subunit delta